MIIIHHSILHILDFNSGVTVFSDNELVVENSVETFLLKHLEKSFTDSNLKTGTFYENSAFQATLRSYLNEETSFVEVSKTLANYAYTMIQRIENPESADILICDISVDTERFMVFLKCDNRMGFVHQVMQDEDGVKNDIINHYAIMPTLSQKIDECAFISAENLSIKFTDKKYSIDGDSAFLLADYILQCDFRLSGKESFKAIHHIAKKVAEEHGQNSVDTLVKAKNFIASNAELSDSLNPEALGREVFAASPMLQQEYIKEIRTAGIGEQVNLERDFAIKKSRTHRIKTDTGIELIIPVEYFENQDYVEFINNSNGTVSINLKNIAKLINK